MLTECKKKIGKIFSGEGVALQSRTFLYFKRPISCRPLVFSGSTKVFYG